MQTKEGHREREGGRKSKVGFALTTHSSMWGSNSRTLRSWPEPKSEAWLTEPPRCPHFTLFKFFIEREMTQVSEVREQERQNPTRGRQTGRDSERRGAHLKRGSCSPKAGLEPTQSKAQTHEIITWAEARCLTNWATPAPPLYLLTPAC